jgi:hypothetical protein
MRVVAACVSTRCAVLMLALWPMSAPAQSVQFRGRVVMAAGGPPFQQMKVRIDRFGTATPNDGGFFTAAIPAGVMSVTIQVETGNPRWTLRYPVAAIAVPRDANFVTDIIVGPSIEETLSRDYAASIARLRTSLRSAGAADTQVLAAIESLRREFAERTNVRVDDLRAAERVTSERARILPGLSATVEMFTIKADNLAMVFQYLLESSFSSDSAFAQLNRGLLEYNAAYEALKTGRAGFESGVSQAWQNAQISADFRALMDYALGDVHATEILPLNDVLPDVSRVLTGVLRGADAQSKRAEVLARVRITGTALRARLDELERRKVRVMTALQDS